MLFSHTLLLEIDIDYLTSVFPSKYFLLNVRNRSVSTGQEVAAQSLVNGGEQRKSHNFTAHCMSSSIPSQLDCIRIIFLMTITLPEE